MDRLSEATSNESKELALAVSTAQRPWSAHHLSEMRHVGPQLLSGVLEAGKCITARFLLEGLHFRVPPGVLALRGRLLEGGVSVHGSLVSLACSNC
jgi:hypothetical protein